MKQHKQVLSSEEKLASPCVWLRIFHLLLFGKERSYEIYSSTVYAYDYSSTCEVAGSVGGSTLLLPRLFVCSCICLLVTVTVTVKNGKKMFGPRPKPQSSNLGVIIRYESISYNRYASKFIPVCLFIHRNALCAWWILKSSDLFKIWTFSKNKKVSYWYQKMQQSTIFQKSVVFCG